MSRFPQQNHCSWDGSPGANSPTLPRCGAQGALVHRVLLCGVSDTAVLWGWFGDNAHSGSTSLGRCMGNDGKLLRGALCRMCPWQCLAQSRGSRDRLGGPVSRSAASSRLEHLQRRFIGPGMLQEPHVPYDDSRVPIWLGWGCVLSVLPHCGTRATLFAPRPGSNQLDILCALQKYSSSSPQRYLPQDAGHPSKSSKGFYKPRSDFWKYAWHLQITQVFLSGGACSQHRYSGCAKNVDRHQQGAEIWSRIVSPIMCSGLGKGNCSEPQLLGFQLALQLCSSSQSAFLACCCKQGCSDS